MKKKEQEQDKRRAVSQIEQLQTAKTLLEREVNAHKKRLQVEAQATRQVTQFVTNLLYFSNKCSCVFI